MVFLSVVLAVFVAMLATACRHSGVNVYQGRDDAETLNYLKAMKN